MTVIWCMVPEIWSATAKIFCCLGPFFALLSPTTQKIKILKKWEKTPGDIILHMCTINGNHMMYGFWDMKRDRQIFLSFWTVFCPFYPHNNPKNQNLEKLKKPPRNITILHMCTINDNHVMCGSWDIEHKGQIFLSSWAICCPFTSLTTWKIKILKKWKKSLEISSFTYVYHEWKSHDVWFLRYGAWWTEFFVIWDHFLPFYPPKNLKNDFTKMYQKSWSYAILFLTNGAWRM